MTSELRATETTKPGHSTAATQRAPYWLGCVAIYLAVLVLYAPSLRYAALPLDDQSLLHDVAALPLGDLFSWDHFGHFRPLKNLLFWERESCGHRRSGASLRPGRSKKEGAVCREAYKKGHGPPLGGPASFERRARGHWKVAGRVLRLRDLRAAQDLRYEQTRGV